jgi:antitoxin CptB
MARAPIYIGRSAMDTRRSKLKYRAWRRGFLEADLILGPFADARLDAMAPAELDIFESLLEQTDHDLYAWILGDERAPAALVEVLDEIRSHRLAAASLSQA